MLVSSHELTAKITCLLFRNQNTAQLLTVKEKKIRIVKQRMWNREKESAEQGATSRFKKTKVGTGRTKTPL